MPSSASTDIAHRWHCSHAHTHKGKQILVKCFSGGCVWEPLLKLQTPFSSANVPIYQSERPIRRLYSPASDPHPGWITGPWFSLSISSFKGNVCRSAHLQKSSMSQSLYGEHVREGDYLNVAVGQSYLTPERPWEEFLGKTCRHEWFGLGTEGTPAC